MSSDTNKVTGQVKTTSSALLQTDWTVGYSGLVSSKQITTN